MFLSIKEVKQSEVEVGLVANVFVQNGICRILALKRSPIFRGYSRSIRSNSLQSLVRNLLT